jgi:hypothetical protein
MAAESHRTDTDSVASTRPRRRIVPNKADEESDGETLMLDLNPDLL